MKWANHNLRSDSKKQSIHTGVKVNHQCVCWLLSDFLHFPECPPSSLEELARTFFISLWVSLWVLKPVVVNCSSFSENDRCTHQSVCNRLLYKWWERHSCCLCAVMAAEKYWELVNKHASGLCSEAGCCPSLKPKQSWFQFWKLMCGLQVLILSCDTHQFWPYGTEHKAEHVPL